MQNFYFINEILCQFTTAAEHVVGHVAEALNIPVISYGVTPINPIDYYSNIILNTNRSDLTIYIKSNTKKPSAYTSIVDGLKLIRSDTWSNRPMYTLCLPLKLDEVDYKRCVDDLKALVYGEQPESIHFFGDTRRCKQLESILTCVLHPFTFQFCEEFLE